MTLEEAIGYLQGDLYEAENEGAELSAKAIQLGIEALKRIKERRDLKTGWEKQLLPSETEE